MSCRWHFICDYTQKSSYDFQAGRLARFAWDDLGDQVSIDCRIDLNESCSISV